MKRDGTASDKREGDGSYAPPTESDRPPSVDEPIAGKPQSTPSPDISTLMTEVLDIENLKRALERVKRNKGAPGIDGMTVDELRGHLKANWPTIRAQLVAGSYCPKPVRRVEIPKPDGRTRLLGIPTVTDRFIQQALAQVVQRQAGCGATLVRVFAGGYIKDATVVGVESTCVCRRGAKEGGGGVFK